MTVLLKTQISGKFMPGNNEKATDGMAYLQLQLEYSVLCHSIILLFAFYCVLIFISHLLLVVESLSQGIFINQVTLIMRFESCLMCLASVTYICMALRQLSTTLDQFYQPLRLNFIVKALVQHRPIIIGQVFTCWVLGVFNFIVFRKNQT